MNSDDEILLIDRFLADELSPEEILVFDQKCRENPQFASRVLMLKETRDLVADKKRVALEKNLQVLRQKHSASQTPVKSMSFLVQQRNTWMVAAAILCILTLGALAFYLSKTSFDSTQELYAYYYQPAYLEVVRNNANSTADDQLTMSAFNAYEEMDYDEAINLFNQVKPRDISESTKDYFLAHCYLNTGRTDQAVKLLTTVIKDGDNLYIQDAQWYLSLAYLKKGNLDKAQQALTLLVKQSPNHKKAPALLENISTLEK